MTVAVEQYIAAGLERYTPAKLLSGAATDSQRAVIARPSPCPLCSVARARDVSA